MFITAVLYSEGQNYSPSKWKAAAISDSDCQSASFPLVFDLAALKPETRKVNTFALRDLPPILSRCFCAAGPDAELSSGGTTTRTHAQRRKCGKLFCSNWCTEMGQMDIKRRHADLRTNLANSHRRCNFQGQNISIYDTSARQYHTVQSVRELAAPAGPSHWRPMKAPLRRDPPIVFRQSPPNLHITWSTNRRSRDVEGAGKATQVTAAPSFQSVTHVRKCQGGRRDVAAFMM